MGWALGQIRAPLPVKGIHNKQSQKEDREHQKNICQHERPVYESSRVRSSTSRAASTTLTLVRSCMCWIAFLVCPPRISRSNSGYRPCSFSPPDDSYGFIRPVIETVGVFLVVPPGFRLRWLRSGLGSTTMRTSGCLVADLLLAFVALDYSHTLILLRPTQTRNSGRAKHCWIAGCGWVPRRGAKG